MEIPPLEPETAPPSFEETVEYAPLGHRVAALGLTLGYLVG